MKSLNLFFALILLPIVARAEVSIIVNESNPVTYVTADQVTNFFLKRNKEWSDGTSVRFIDRNDDSAVRKEFLQSVLKRSSRDLELYWIGQKLYNGLSAPMQVGSDNMMAVIVSKFPGAIGYVSGEFTGGKGIKVVPVKEAR